MLRFLHYLLSFVLVVAAYGFGVWKYIQDDSTGTFWGMLSASGALAVFGLRAVLDYGDYRERLGRQSHSEYEKGDRYQKKKKAFEDARKQIANEMSHFEKMQQDSSYGIGNEYAETTPFELLIDRLKLVGVERDYKSLVERITAECNRLLALTGKPKDVKKLIGLLEEIDKKMARWLGEE